MAKKRKTRQEKIIADLRRQIQSQEPEQPVASSIVSTYSLPQTEQIVRPASISTTSNLKPTTYAYVLSDLKKTLLFTIIAIAAQVGLYIVLMR